MIYVFDDLDKINQIHYNRFLNYIPQNRLDRIKRYYRRKDAVLGVVAYIMLLYSLNNEYGIRRVVDFNYNEFGKPKIQDCLVQFSISHCDLGVACAVSDSEIGIDIQDYQSYDCKIIESVCNENEKTEMYCASKKNITFMKFWVLKESYLKYKGTGLTNEMCSLDFSGVISDQFIKYNCEFSLYSFQDYCLSVCGSLRKAGLIKLTLDDLNECIEYINIKVRL